MTLRQVESKTLFVATNWQTSNGSVVGDASTT